MASSRRMNPATRRPWPTPALPADIRTRSIASAAYATDERASEERTARPVAFDSRSDSRCRVSRGRPTSTRLALRQRVMECRSGLPKESRQGGNEDGGDHGGGREAPPAPRVNDEGFKGRQIGGEQEAGARDRDEPARRPGPGD